jgi:hypothetical protein
MPISTICVESTLHQYAETFRLVFTLPQFRHFVTMLLGFILTPERRTLTGCSVGWLVSTPSAF